MFVSAPERELLPLNEARPLAVLFQLPPQLNKRSDLLPMS